MSSGIVLEFDASHHAVVVLLGLGAILVLPLARMPLLKDAMFTCEYGGEGCNHGCGGTLVC